MSKSISTPAPSLKRYLYLSIGAAIATIGLKGGAYLLTGSVGLLSDALESFVNLAAAIMALLMMTSLNVPRTMTMPLATTRPSTSPAASRVHSFSWPQQQLPGPPSTGC